MAMPTYEEVMLPMLRHLSDNAVHSRKELKLSLASYFGLSEEELQKTTPSGHHTLFNSRVSWAQTYLKKAGLISSLKPGHYEITERGQNLLDKKITKLTNKFLMQYPEFVEFWGTGSKAPVSKGGDDNEIIQEKTPQELMDDCYITLRKTLADEILQQIASQSPAFFERLVLDLLIRLGYGGSRQDAASVVGKSGDEGIDGIIKEDRLGLDVIYVQAKRWKDSVGSPAIQGFIGALQLKSAHKGIFITTSTFTAAARDIAAKVGNRIVLIDGMQLADLMIEFGVGVSTEMAYEIKRIDSDYFSEA